MFSTMPIFLYPWLEKARNRIRNGFVHLASLINTDGDHFGYHGSTENLVRERNWLQAARPTLHLKRSGRSDSADPGGLAGTESTASMDRETSMQLYLLVAKIVEHSDYRLIRVPMLAIYAVYFTFQ